MYLRAGSKVKWSSHGPVTPHTDIEKVGKVLATIKKGQSPDQYRAIYKDTHKFMFGEESQERDHDSYLIEVQPGGKAKPRIYRPLVSKLRRVTKLKVVKIDTFSR